LGAFVFFQAEDGIRDRNVTGVQTCALPILHVNSIIEERLDKNFLIGHSYFITDDETIDDFDTWFGDIVEFDIMPMIEEYFFDDRSEERRVGKECSGGRSG